MLVLSSTFSENTFIMTLYKYLNITPEVALCRTQSLICCAGRTPYQNLKSVHGNTFAPPVVGVWNILLNNAVTAPNPVSFKSLLNPLVAGLADKLRQPVQ